jgi:small subunit ribosomal protein S14
MKYYIFKDAEKYKKLKTKFIKKILFKCLIRENKLKFTQKQKLIIAISRLRKHSHVRIKPRCLITGRARSTIQEFKLSRIKFREFALSGFITGLRKASW